MTGPRGTTNRDARGSTTDRRRRREWLVATFGFELAGQRVVACHFCTGLLTVDTVSADRIVPGIEGGRYVRSNLRPACLPCQSRTGSLLGHERRRLRTLTASDKVMT